MFIDLIRLLLIVQLLAYKCSGVIKNKKEYIKPFNINYFKKENNFVNLQKLKIPQKLSTNFGNLNGGNSSNNLVGVNLLSILPVNLIEIGKSSLNPINRILKRPNLICQYINISNNIFIRNLNYSSKLNLKNIKEEYFKKQYQNFKRYNQEELNNIIVNNNQKKEENKMKFKKGRVLMSYFKNRQGLKIRTYASEVDNPLGKVFLVHGIRSHFRAEFTAYNIDWYYNHIGESVTETAHQTQEMEKRMIFPSKNQEQLLKGGDNYSTLDGKDALELTPRFIYEGTFLEYLNNLGYSTYGLDLQSHGLSESLTEKRCYFENFDDVCYDLLQFISLVKKGKFHDTNQTYKQEEVFEKEKEEKNITTSTLYKSKNFGLNMEEKYYLMGLSMGGNVVMRSMELYSMKMGKNKKIVDALVCLAGMINIDYHFQGFLLKCLPLVKFISKLKSGLKVGQANDPGLCLTSHLRGNDPVYYKHKLYLRIALMIFQATKTLERDFEYYPTNLPTLFLHTVNDTMCDVKGPRDLMNKYFKGVEHARLHELEGETHVISSPLFTTITGPLVDKFFQDEQNKWTNN